MWSIGEVRNDVDISDACAMEMFHSVECPEDLSWYDCEDVAHEGRLFFNPDHYEWMDYLDTHSVLVDVLKKHKVKGDICFGSLEGDNAGKFWGYRFDGNGNMQRLHGAIVWAEA